MMMAPPFAHHKQTRLRQQRGSLRAELHHRASAHRAAGPAGAAPVPAAVEAGVALAPAAVELVDEAAVPMVAVCCRLVALGRSASRLRANGCAHAPTPLCQGGEAEHGITLSAIATARWIEGELGMGEPTAGELVTLLPSAGAAAGKKYMYPGRLPWKPC